MPWRRWHARASTSATPRRTAPHGPPNGKTVVLLHGNNFAGFYFGNIAEALRAYEELRVLLREELGTFPSPQLTALHDQLLNAHESGEAEPAAAAAQNGGAVTTPRPVVSIAERIDPAIDRGGMVGRGAVLDQLASEMEKAASGELRIALLTGEGGLGKTRLAAEFARRCEDTTVLYGRCEPEDVRPFGIWIGLLRSALRQTPDDELAGTGNRCRVRAPRPLRRRAPADRPPVPYASDADHPRRPAVGRPLDPEAAPPARR